MQQSTLIGKIKQLMWFNLGMVDTELFYCRPTDRGVPGCPKSHSTRLTGGCWRRGQMYRLWLCKTMLWILRHEIHSCWLNLCSNIPDRTRLLHGAWLTIWRSDLIIHRFIQSWYIGSLSSKTLTPSPTSVTYKAMHSRDMIEVADWLDCWLAKAVGYLRSSYITCTVDIPKLLTTTRQGSGIFLKHVQRQQKLL